MRCWWLVFVLTGCDLTWGQHHGARPAGGDDEGAPDAGVDMGPSIDAPTDAPWSVMSSGTFGVPTSYATDVLPSALAIGDFNGDGRPDVATANNKNQGTNINTIGTVSVLLSNANGTLQAATHYTAGYGPVGVVTADFNRDGKLDLVTTNLAQGLGGNATILLGNGDGTFGAPTAITACCSPEGIAAGDLNGDGNPDLAIANYLAIQVLLGDGTGRFGAPVAQALSGAPFSLALGDLNRDGKLDVVSGYNINANPDRVAVSLGNGTGALQPATRYDTYRSTNRIALGDLDRDGNLDVITANLAANDISVLRGTSMGALLDPTQYTMGAATTHAAIGDFNGDGKPDVAASAGDANSVVVRLGNGDGTFGASAFYMTQSSPCAVGTADFNCDGRADLAVVNAASNSVSILLGQP